MDLLNTLLEIQSLDIRKAEIEKMSETIPQQKKDIIAGLKKDKQAYEELNSEIKAADKICKDISFETEKIRTQKQKIIDQAGSTKDNATYTKLIEESKNYDSQIDALDEKFLLQLDAVEEIKVKRSELAEKLKALLAKIEQDLKDLDQRHTNLKATLPETESKRAELAKNIDIDLLHHYERVLKSKGSLREVIVPITHDDSCGFCHIKLSSKDMSSAIHGLGECLECGAMLYH